eukprot:scaffold7895_cov150-Skeletonema_marinoi.AAC.2
MTPRSKTNNNNNNNDTLRSLKAIDRGRRNVHPHNSRQRNQKSTADARRTRELITNANTTARKRRLILDVDTVARKENEHSSRNERMESVRIEKHAGGKDQ